MDWLFKNIGFFVFVAIMVASLLSKIKKAGRPPPARRVADADVSEHTRRVQEEIRRKIAERAVRAPSAPQPPVMAGGGPSPAPPVVVSQPAPRSPNIFEELVRQMAEAKKSAEAQTRAAAEEQTRQRVQSEEEKTRDLAEARHLAEVRRAVQQKQRAAEMTAAFNAADPKLAAVDRRAQLLADLRQPASLRRALVLREILGDPVGMR